MKIIFSLIWRTFFIYSLRSFYVGFSDIDPFLFLVHGHLFLLELQTRENVVREREYLCKRDQRILPVIQCKWNSYLNNEENICYHISLNSTNIKNYDGLIFCTLIIFCLCKTYYYTYFQTIWQLFWTFQYCTIDTIYADIRVRTL